MLSITNTIGSWCTPARFMASWASPRAIAPSPHQPSATRGSPRSLKASAQPTATGIIAGRWLTIAIRPSRKSAMCTLPSLPRAKPSARPMYWAKIRHGSVPRVTCTPMSRCTGAPTSSARMALATPTDAALVAAAGVEAAGDLALAVEDVARSSIPRVINMLR